MPAFSLSTPDRGEVETVPIADAPAPPAPAIHAQARASRLERGVFRAINRARRRHGLPRVRFSRRLGFVAKLHSYDLATHFQLSHSSSNGTSFDRRIRTMARANRVGETIIGYRGHTTGRRIVRAWMRSPSHRRQLMTWGYRRAGVGRASANGYTVVTADFASR